MARLDLDALTRRINLFHNKSKEKFLEDVLRSKVRPRIRGKITKLSLLIRRVNLEIHYKGDSKEKWIIKQMGKTLGEKEFNFKITIPSSVSSL